MAVLHHNRLWIAHDYVTNVDSRKIKQFGLTTKTYWFKIAIEREDIMKRELSYEKQLEKNDLG
jgi:hypothetical protein